MFCTACGKELKPGKKFCIYCGEPVLSEDSDAQGDPEDILNEDATEILGDETVTLKDDLQSQEPDPSDESLNRTVLAEEDEATVCLGLGADGSSNASDASARFSQSIGAQKIVLKYMDHVIDESKVRGEKYVSPNESSSSSSVIVKVLILIVIVALIAAVGVGVYFFVNSRKTEKSISAPEIKVEEQEDNT